MSEDINVGAISEALNNKADLDMNNISTQGKDLISYLVTPSNHENNPYVSLPIPASGAQITAPADGYIYVDWNNTSPGGWVNLDNIDIFMTSNATRGYYYDCFYSSYVPCKKGNRIIVTYDVVNITSLRCIKLEGEQ